MIAPQSLYENVPLDTSAKLGAYFEDTLIGHYYGDLTASRVRCIKVDTALYLVSAHPWQSITAAYISGQKTTAFAAITRPDIDGVTRQYIEFSTPPAEDNAVVMVSGKGKMSSTAGHLLENPDEIIADIAALCGRTLSFPLFREACRRKGIKVAGAIYEARSLRDYVNEIVTSVGAKWLGNNVIFPMDPLTYALPVDVDTVAQAISMDDVAGVQGIYYGWNQGSDRYGNYMEVTAVGCQYTNKGIYNARWLRSAKDAEALARQILTRRAGAVLKTTATIPALVRAGDVVAIADAPFPGPMLVTSSQPSEVESQVSGEVLVTAFENMKLTMFSNENQASRSERVDVLLDLKKQTATITIFDSQNTPMVGIYVTYDYGETQKTNAIGQVVFTTTSGAHSLILNGEGIESSEPYPLIIP
jgi:hypothetical protein